MREQGNAEMRIMMLVDWKVDGEFVAPYCDKIDQEERYPAPS